MKHCILIVFAVVHFCSYVGGRTSKKLDPLLLAGIYNASDCRTLASVYSTENSKGTCSFDRSTNIHRCSVVSPPTGNYIYEDILS